MGERKCSACGHINEAYAPAPYAACPECERIYDRADAAAAIRAARNVGGTAEPEAAVSSAASQAPKVQTPELVGPADPGAPRPAALSASAAQGVGLALALAVSGLLLWGILQNPPSPTSSAASSSTQARVETTAERYRASATASCKPRIQALAKWDYEWTDGWTVPVFSHSREVGDGTIAYVGDRLKLQNGFGAWAHVKYGCIYDPRAGRVVDVQITN